MRVLGPLAPAPGHTTHVYGPAEAGAVSSMLGAAYADYARTDPAYHLEVEVPEQIRREMAAGEQMVVLRRGGTDIGLVKTREDPEAGLLHFRRLASRGGGTTEVCGTLIEWLAREAARRGLSGIRCHAVPRHADLGFLRRTGDLRVVGDEAVGFSNGAQEIVLRLEAPIPSDDLALIEFEPDDAAALTAVVHEAFREVHDRGVPSPAMMTTPAQWLQMLQRRAVALGVRTAGRAIGAVVLHPCTDARTGADLEFSHLAVVPQQRGRGAARMLLDEVRQRARSHGARRVSCVVHADRDQALQVLTHHGFRIAERGLQLDGRGELIPTVRLTAPV